LGRRPTQVRRPTQGRRPTQARRQIHRFRNRISINETAPRTLAERRLGSRDPFPMNRGAVPKLLA
jgi:hypothetical protein